MTKVIHLWQYFFDWKSINFWIGECVGGFCEFSSLYPSVCPSVCNTHFSGFSHYLFPGFCIKFGNRKDNTYFAQSGVLCFSSAIQCQNLGSIVALYLLILKEVKFFPDLINIIFCLGVSFDFIVIGNISESITCITDFHYFWVGIQFCNKLLCTAIYRSISKRASIYLDGLVDLYQLPIRMKMSPATFSLMQKSVLIGRK